jgi:hypothetical protein
MRGPSVPCFANDRPEAVVANVSSVSLHAVDHDLAHGLLEAGRASCISKLLQKRYGVLCTSKGRNEEQGTDTRGGNFTAEPLGTQAT